MIDPPSIRGTPHLASHVPRRIRVRLTVSGPITKRDRVRQYQFLHTFQPDDFDEAVEDESGVSLAKALGARTKRFLYVYDFGDNWEHEVVVEKIVAGNSGSERPLCLGGKRHRPPEDSGGPPGYLNFLEAIRSPAHEEHDT